MTCKETMVNNRVKTSTWTRKRLTNSCEKRKQRPNDSRPMKREPKSRERRQKEGQKSSPPSGQFDLSPAASLNAPPKPSTWTPWTGQLESSRWASSRTSKRGTASPCIPSWSTWTPRNTMTGLSTRAAYLSLMATALTSGQTKKVN